MKDVLKKFTSRKFLAALAGVISGLAMVFGLDEHIIGQVSGAIVSVASVVSYIVTEGKIDAAAVGQAAEDVAEAIEGIIGGTSTTVYPDGTVQTTTTATTAPGEVTSGYVDTESVETEKAEK